MRFIIIGAEISGAQAARDLIDIYNIPPQNITVLEKNNRIGGKLYTDYALNAEIGGVGLTPLSPTIPYLRRYQLRTNPIPSFDATNTNQLYYDQPTVTWAQRWKTTIRATVQAAIITTHVFYNQVSSYFSIPMAETYRKPFTEMLNQAPEVRHALKVFIPAMGYRFSDYTFRMFNYIGILFIPTVLCSPYAGHFFNSIDGGYQRVVEKMFTDVDVKLNVNIQGIERSDHGVTVSFSEGQHQEDHTTAITMPADYLICTASPAQWETLFKDGLTPIENKCIHELIMYRYPVAIVDIKDFPYGEYFPAKALNDDLDGHVAFIHTNAIEAGACGLSEGYRRCTVFVNLPQGKNDFSLDEGSPGREQLLQDLAALGFTEAIIQKTIIWEDYNPQLTHATSEELEREQGNYGTIYLGTYTSTSFENVTTAMTYTKKTLRRLFNTPEENYYQKIYNSVSNLHTFFYQLPHNPRLNHRETIDVENQSREDVFRSTNANQ